MKMNFIVHYVKNNIVSIVELYFIKIKHAKNIKYLIQKIKMIYNLKNLLKVINLKCVQNVNFGLKRIKVVIIWLVDVVINFVMNVVVSICNVNVYKNKQNC